MARNFEFVSGVFLLFLLVHSFYIYPPINSSMLSVFFLFALAFVFKQSFLTTTYKLSTHKNLISLYFLILLMFLASISIPFLHGTLDLSYSKNFISQTIQLVLIIFVFSFIFHNYKEKRFTPTEFAERLIVWIFVMQSVVQILAFLSPQIASIVHLFYTDKAFERLYVGYGGIRGLALTGSPGWGLAVGYGLAFLFYVKAYIVNRKITVVTISLGLLLVLGTFFAGQSGFVGAILGIVFYLVASGNPVIKIRNAVYGLVLLLGLVLAVYFSLPNFVALLQDRVFPFVFEFLYKYASTGELQTNSTNILMQMWAVEISDITYLIGTGWFTDPNTGAYYMHTDVGYIRNVLFGGIVWIFFLFLYQAKLIGLNYVNYKSTPKNTKKLIVFIFIYLAILEAKAMTIGFNKYMFSIVVFYSLALVYERYFWKRSTT